MESAQLDESGLNERLRLARALLERPRRQEPAWPALAAAAFFAVSALGFAYAAVTAPPAKFTPVPVDTPQAPPTTGLQTPP